MRRTPKLREYSYSRLRLIGSAKGEAPMARKKVLIFSFVIGSQRKSVFDFRQGKGMQAVFVFAKLCSENLKPTLAL